MHGRDARHCSVFLLTHCRQLLQDMWSLHDTRQIKSFELWSTVTHGEFVTETWNLRTCCWWGSYMLPTTPPCAWQILAFLTRPRQMFNLMFLVFTCADSVQLSHVESILGLFRSHAKPLFPLGQASGNVWSHQISHIKSRFSDASMNEIPPMDSFAPWTNKIYNWRRSSR